MSREGLLDELSARSTILRGLKYSQATVSVYRGEYEGQIAAVKILTLVEGVDYHHLEAECAMMKNLSHPNIVRLLSSFWLSKGNLSYFVIITEWCNKDLAEDMTQRATNTFPWTEEQLFRISEQLLSALSMLQCEGIAHRDIKPENIFLDAHQTVKLGDFGSAKNLSLNEHSSTLIGTPYYLSPKLREAFSNHQAFVQHDVAKSDVFSLGLTLLAIANLSPPPELARPATTQADIDRAIAALNYTDSFRNFLRYMLAFEERERWDFTDLYNRFFLKVPESTSEETYYQAETRLSDWNEPQPIPAYTAASSHPGETHVPGIQEPPPQPYYDYPSPPLPADYVPQPAAFFDPKEERKEPKEQDVQREEWPEQAKSVLQPLLGRTSVPVPVDPVCLQCGKPVDRFGPNAKCDVVQLYCQPAMHMFCSRECFCTFAETRKKCPECNEEIAPDTLTFYKVVQKQQSSEPKPAPRQAKRSFWRVCCSCFF